MESQKLGKDRDYQRNLLLQSARAELVVLMNQASQSQCWASSLAVMYEEMDRVGVPSNVTQFKFPNFRTPIFDHNIDRLGLLGISLAADLIIVCSRAEMPKEVNLDQPIPLKMLAGMYKGTAEGLSDWHGELHHVAMRLLATETGGDDPGILLKFRQKRDAERQKKSEGSSSAT